MPSKKPNDNASVKTDANSKKSLLESREDLFLKWTIRGWFESKNLDDSIRTIFQELFMGIYDDLTEKFNDKKRDELFINFMNIVFPTVLDVYKWHESEKAHKDIGLLKALNEISITDWYIELLSSYSKMYSRET